MPVGSGERVSTGIAGLDGLLYGGIPVTDQVLIAGGPGSGKTLLCFEIMYRVAKTGTPVLFVTLEETVDDLLKNVKSAFPDFADVDQLITNKTVTIVNNTMTTQMGTDTERDLISTLATVTAGVERSIRETNAKLVVLDSISVLKLVSASHGALTYRRALLGLMSSLRKLGVTALLTIELASTERKEIKFSPEFFIFDGIIVMYQSESEQKRSYNLEIVKMRRTQHSLSFAPYEITSKGFRILVVEGGDIY